MIRVVFKILIFVSLWVALAALIPIPENISAFSWRLCAEAIAFAAAILLSVIFTAIEKQKVRINVLKVSKDTLTGLVLGCLWIGISAGIMALMGISFDRTGSGANVLIWLIPVFLNAAAQELLVRGYVYQLLKQEYNLIVATIVTTLLFVLFHGGTISEGALPIVNIVLTSLLLTACLEAFNGLTVPIMMHFVWNGIGGIVLGGVNLAEDYPSLFSMHSQAPSILSGGICKMEGSIVAFVINIILFGGVLAWKRKSA